MTVEELIEYLGTFPKHLAVGYEQHDTPDIVEVGSGEIVMVEPVGNGFEHHYSKKLQPKMQDIILLYRKPD